MYLSIAFTRHTGAEHDFLRSVDQSTALGLFWIDIIMPILDEVQARRLLEIGAHKGQNTNNLLNYCVERGGQLTVIEPVVTTELRLVLGQSPTAKLVAKKSLEALPAMNDYVDAVILEGDLNCFSVHKDLDAIKQLSERTNRPFPLVFFSNSSWPYARRDMYYDPDGIPSAVRQPYARSGMTPWARNLKEGLINFPFANACLEGGGGNGVLTGVEAFLSESGAGLNYLSLPVNHGLGIIYRKGTSLDEYLQQNIVPSPVLVRFLETLEIARLNSVTRSLENKPSIWQLCWRGILNPIIGKIRGGT